jgi:hypothetical protein
MTSLSCGQNEYRGDRFLPSNRVPDYHVTLHKLYDVLMQFQLACGGMMDTKC